MLHLLFFLEDQRYALPARHIVEVLPLVEVRPLPQAPPGVVGVFNYRGSPVPLLDLKLLIHGEPSHPWYSSRIVVVEDGGQSGRPVGLCVERATVMTQYDPEVFRATGVPAGTAAYLGGVALAPDGMTQRLDLDRLLTDVLRVQLAEALKEGMEHVPA